jgi:hypothetical protein
MRNKLLLLAIGIMLSAQTLTAQVPSYVPTDGLVGYWPFSGNANDVSGNNRNGVVNSVNSTVYYPTGINGNCIYLTGSGHTGTNGDHVILPAIGFNNFPSYTISMWVKHDGNSSPINHDESYICGHSSLNNCQGTFSIECGVGFPNTGVGYSNHYVGGSDDSPFAGIWVLRTMVINNGSISIYRNGTLISTQQGSNLTDPESEIGLGTHWFCSGGSQSTRFIGAFDELGIWNRALTPQEITSIYNQVPIYSDTCNNVSGSLTQGLVGYWPFCGNANDESGNGNNGTNNGAALTADRFGNANSAYEFNMNYIKVNNSGIYNFNDNLSINVWYKISDNMGAITSNTVFVSKHEAASLDSSYVLYNENNCGPTVYQTDVNGNIGYIRNSAFCDTSSWHMLTLTFNNPNMTMYLDGIYYSTISANSINQTTLPLVFGGANNSSNTDDIIGSMKGKLDDIGIWNRALTQQEITNLYNVNQCITNITVTDTLIINVGQLSFNEPVTWANNITIAPNPASSQININFNNITDLNGGSLKVINSLGQEVATTPITTSGTNSIMQLATWGGSGMYYVQIINPQGIVVDVKKIILQ